MLDDVAGMAREGREQRVGLADAQAVELDEGVPIEVEMHGGAQGPEPGFPSEKTARTLRAARQAAIPVAE